MEEKILLESKNDYKKKVLKIMIAALLLAIAAYLLFLLSNYVPSNAWNRYRDEIITYDEYDKISRIWARPWALSLYTGIACVSVFAISLVIFIYVKSTKMVITNKRVYGIAGLGKRVDLPIDSISAVATCWLRGLAVATSSGRIVFLGLSNRDKLHKTINKLLIERQEKKASPVMAPVMSRSNAEELKQYKELLEMGVITQEEFNAKKKQLLGL